MKIIFFLFILLMTVSCSEKQPTLETIEMTSENLELFALKTSSDELKNKYILNLIKINHPKEYYPIIEDRDKVAALLEKHVKENMLAASKLSENTNFRIEKNIYYSKFDADTSSLVVKNFLIGNAMPISSIKSVDDGMPSNFILLIPNVELMNNFTVNPKKFQSLIDDSKYLRNKSLFMEIVVNLAKFQNGDNFQTVIKQVNIYESDKKEYLLASNVETRSTQDLINNWLLSDGYTNKLIGIHAYSFFGYRLQDQLRIASNIKENCDKTKKIGPHQVVVCNQPFKKNVIIVSTYIGGILAKMDLVAKAKLSENEKKVIMMQIRKNLGQDDSLLMKKHSSWVNHGTDFNFFTDAFEGTKSPQSKYNYSFGTNEEYANLDLTLIITMMSHETKKLIEENK